MRSGYSIAGRLVLPEGDISQGVLTIREGKIASVMPRESFAGTIDRDFGNLYIGPGFIDIHVHGGGGRDFMSGDVREVVEALQFHAAHGTTGILPTTVTASGERTRAALEAIRTVMEMQRCVGRRSAGPEEPPDSLGSGILGVHLEGPYVNAAFRGGQDPRWIRPPSLAEYRAWEASVPVKMITLAPELEGAGELIRYIADQARRTGEKTLISAGHTNASLADIDAAAGLGLTHLTHFFNAMRGLHHREPGTVGAGLTKPELTLELIADGIHVHPDLLRWVVAVKGYRSVALITDAVMFCGVPDGSYMKNGRNYTVENGSIRMDDGMLAGSSLTMNRAVGSMAAAGVPLAEAWAMASGVPARLIGTEGGKGRLAAGADADIAVLDERFGVAWVCVKGDIAYSRE